MAAQVELDPSVCQDCPLVQAVNEAWADFELFDVSVNMTGIDAGPDEKVSDEITDSVLRLYKNDMERYATVLQKLSDYTKANGCIGRQSGNWTGIFCGVEGKLREQGTVVPEYELRGKQ